MTLAIPPVPYPLAALEGGACRVLYGLQRFSSSAHRASNARISPSLYEIERL